MEKALHNLDDLDPLAEADTIEGRDSFLQSQGVPAAERAQTVKVLCSRDFAENREAESSARQESEDDAALILVQDDRADEELAMKRLDSKFKQQSWNRERTQWLGTDPKEARTKLRAELQQGFYVSTSGKRNICTLHQLGTRTQDPRCPVPQTSTACASGVPSRQVSTTQSTNLRSLIPLHQVSQESEVPELWFELWPRRSPGLGFQKSFWLELPQRLENVRRHQNMSH